LLLVPHLHGCATCAGLQEGQELCDYKIEVQTGDVRGAGTDANVEVGAVCRTVLLSGLIIPMPCAQAAAQDALS